MAKPKGEKRVRAQQTLMSARFEKGSARIYLFLRDHGDKKPESRYRIGWRLTDGDHKDGGINTVHEQRKDAESAFESCASAMAKQGGWAKGVVGTRPGRKVSIKSLPFQYVKPPKK